MLAPAISKTNLKSYDVPLDDLQSASAALAEIAASPAGPEMGAFFDDDAGLLTGNIVRPIVWGPTKAAAVQNFCTDNAVMLDDSYFYADGDEDAALMAQVGYPRPVNPRPRLAAVAGERGWPVLRVTGSGSRPRVRSMLRNGA
jgi:hypothetical protein